MGGMEKFENSGTLHGAKGEAKSGSSGNVFGGFHSAGINLGQPSMANQLIILALGCGAAWLYFTHIKGSK